MKCEQIMRRFTWHVIHRFILVVVGLALIAAAGGPAMARAQDATPAPVTGAMQEMFAKVPATLPGVDDPAQLMVSFADIAAQLDSMGIPTPSDFDAPFINAWIAATRGMALPPTASQHLPSFRDDFGFDLLQADQTLSVSLPPFDLTLYRGRFELDTVRGTLEANGYQPVNVGGHELLSVRGDNEINFDAPARYAMATMNFAAILGDGTLVFASTGGAVAAVLDVVAADAPSMTDVAGYSMLLHQAPVDLVSAVVVQGTALAATIPPSLLELDPGATPDLSAAATEIAAAGEMPPVVMAMLGSTAGGPLQIGDELLPLPPNAPDARAVAALLMLSPGAAESAAAIVEQRLETGVSERTSEPFSTLFPAWEVRTETQAPTVVADLELSPGTSQNILINMLYARDLSFLAW